MQEELEERERAFKKQKMEKAKEAKEVLLAVQLVPVPLLVLVLASQKLISRLPSVAG